MAKYYELKSEEVRKQCPVEILPFETTEELESLEEIIGQSRAIDSIEYGLKIKTDGYNIFMAGEPGTGKASYAKKVSEKLAKDSATPNDWCYVHNFENPDRPLALSFTAGEGKKFVQRMETLLKNLIEEIPRIYESEEYEKKKGDLINEFQKGRDELIDELEKYALERGFILQEKKAGIITMPSIKGRPITEEEFENLSESEKLRYQKASEEIQQKAMAVFRQIRELEKKYKEMIEILNQITGSLVVKKIFQEIFETYQNSPEILKYLELYKNDVLKSLNEFREKSDQSIIPFLEKENGNEKFIRYRVNLFIDNSQLSGAPVVYETNPSFYRLMGKVEYVSKVGSLVTSFLQIRPGALHKANGGYLILSAKDLLINSDSWLALKRALKTKLIQIESLGESYGLVSVTSLRPEPIPLNVKIILLGNQFLYQLLFKYDEDFRKLFKIKADFGDTMERSNNNILKLARFVRTYTHEQKMLPFKAEAIAELVDYSSRLAENQEKMTTHFNQLLEIINEAETWARLTGSDVVRREDVIKTIKEKIRRSNLTEEIIHENIRNGTLMIQCTGYQIGQVNALVVVNFGDYSFGYPAKITSVAYKGQKGVIHIERETKMSGPIHDKGLMILSNFIGARYAQEQSLTLSASLTFEQVYTNIDGDSASCAELIALLSSIAQVPVFQSIAITGSVNQHGEIQPIGGVNEKVEGFFKICKLFGLTGDQGVIIPEKNIKNLMLDREIVKSIEKKDFHIYPIRTIDEGIEIMTGIPAGHLRRDGSYPKNTFNYLVLERLKYFAKQNEKN